MSDSKYLVKNKCINIGIFNSCNRVEKSLKTFVKWRILQHCSSQRNTKPCEVLPSFNNMVFV